MEKDNISFKVKIKNKLNLWFAKLYLGNSTRIITICWIMASFHLTILYKYENCINTCDNKNTFLSIFWISLVVVLTVFVPVILYFYFNKEKIGKEKIDNIQQNNGKMGTKNPEVFILPMYIFCVFSFSKLAVIFHESVVNSFSRDNLIKIIILSLIFLCSLWAWTKFKKTSPKSWSFWITVFAITYVLINIYWDYFLPFLQSYLRTLNCIFTLLLNS